MHRCFLTPSELIGDSAVVFGEEAYHIIKVLRLKPKDEIEICDGEGFEYKAVISKINKDSVNVQIISKTVSQTEPKTQITLFQGLTKSQKMDLIIQKSVELGIKEIVPVTTKNTVIKLDDNKDNKTSRWQKIAQEAAKQSKRGVIPKVSEPISFKDALLMTKENDLNLILYEKEVTQDIKSVLEKNSFKTVGVFIGPEGGFDPEEVKEAHENDLVSVTIGKRILRTETAGISAISVLMYHNNEMK